MADANPTGGGDFVALTIPTDDRKFLLGAFEMARDGIRGELADYPDDLREPTRLHREEAAYEKLLAALDCGAIVADDETRHVLCDLAETVDRANEYQRVVAEHAALLGLRKQLNGRVEAD